MGPKTGDLIKMSFGVIGRVGAGNDVMVYKQTGLPVCWWRRLVYETEIHAAGWSFDRQAVEFINNLKAERSGKKIDVELLEGELADDVRDDYALYVLRCLRLKLHRFDLLSIMKAATGPQEIRDNLQQIEPVEFAP